MKKIILVGFLGILIMLSCSEFNPDQEIVDITSDDPYITGNVTDNNGNPVEGAKVEFFYPYREGGESLPGDHRCSYDYTELNGDYACDMTGHMHGDYCLGICTPPQGSGLETQTKKVYVPGGKDYDDLPLVDWVLLPP